MSIQLSRTVNGVTTTVKSIGKSDSYTLTPDDRQELVKLVDGAICVDGWAVGGHGRRDSGDVVSLTAVFNASDWEDYIEKWWTQRLMANVALENGSTINNARIIIRRISYSENLAWRPKFVTLDLEFWRV